MSSETADQIDYTGTEYPKMMGDKRLTSEEPILVRCPRCSRPIEVKRFESGTDVYFSIRKDGKEQLEDHPTCMHELEAIACQCLEKETSAGFSFDLSAYVNAAIHAALGSKIPGADSFLTDHHNQ